MRFGRHLRPEIYIHHPPLPHSPTSLCAPGAHRNVPPHHFSSPLFRSLVAIDLAENDPDHHRRPPAVWNLAGITLHSRPLNGKKICVNNGSTLRMFPKPLWSFCRKLFISCFHSLTSCYDEHDCEYSYGSWNFASTACIECPHPPGRVSITHYDDLWESQSDNHPSLRGLRVQSAFTAQALIKTQQAQKYHRVVWVLKPQF